MPRSGGSRFDPVAYGVWFNTARGKAVERLEKRSLDLLLPNIEGKRVLDVGSGDGRFSKHLATRGATVTGVDSSTSMVEAARSGTGRHNLMFMEGDTKSLPFADASFDIVVALTVLCFVSDAARALHEIHRVLRPQGVIVLGELNAHSVWAWWRKLRSSMWRSTEMMTLKRMRSLLSDAGFNLNVETGAVFAPPLSGNRYWRIAVVLEEYLKSQSLNLGPALLIVRGEKR